jgi:anti-sigma B factor antagonist
MESSILSAFADDGIATVTVHGEVDFSNADELADHLRDAVAEWSPQTLRVDLAGATFIDSTGLGALIDGYREATRARAAFAVVNPRPAMRRVLTVTGLADFFGLAESETGSESQSETGSGTGRATAEAQTQATGA